MPFIESSLTTIEEDRRVIWLEEKCTVLKALFSAIVRSDEMIAVLNKELFWKNLDTSLFLASALKSALENEELSVKHAYNVLT